MTPSVVLSRPSPCNVPQGYASVAELPAALLGCHFEHPAFWTVFGERAQLRTVLTVLAERVNGKATGNGGLFVCDQRSGD